MSLDRPAADMLAAGKLWLTTPMARGGPITGDMPYLSTALYALVAVPSGDVATMATDPAWRLYVNPEWLADSQLTAPEVGAALAHHVWHLLADHAARASDMGVRGSTSRAWRVAADITVHEVAGGLAERAGGSLAAHVPQGPAPGGSGPAAPTGVRRTGGGAMSRGPAMAARTQALDDHHRLIDAAELGLPAGRAAEEYYAMLTGLPAEDDDPEHDPSWIPRAPADNPSGPDPSCGSGCDGVHRAYELPELWDAGGLSPVAAEAVRCTVAIEFQANPGRGDLPGDWGRWVSTILDPVVDWRNVLHAAVRRGLGWANGHTDYTYTRISRRQAAAGPVILPALRRHVPRIGIVVDTSGSVDDGLLAQALAEIDGVLHALGVADPQVDVLAVDAAVHAVTTVRRADAVHLAGGGGTDMALGITAAQELRPPVDVIIVLTDGQTGWPGQPAAVPVIAVLIGRTRADLPRTPDWIQRVECVR
jgi:predicted metal-dependent peptidase